MGDELIQNLRRLREARAVSQADLARRAGISRVAYGAIEAGKSQPRVENLLRIADALGVRLEELLAPPPPALRAIRFRALKRMTRRQQVLVEVGRWLENYAELEAMLGDRAPYRLDGVAGQLAEMAPGHERARVAASLVRKELGLREDEGIRDICGLLEERAGVKVLPIELASDAFFGLSVGSEDGGPAVVVNAWERISVERWIFTAAHELGHLVLHLGAYDVAQTEEDPDEEKEANFFASYFLMPQEVFEQEWREARGLPLVKRVLKVKRIFRVSYRTVLYRLAERPEYGKQIWPRFQYAHVSAYGKSLVREDEPERVPPADFHAAMVTSEAAGEPHRLSAEDFIEDRWRRLVRMAVEKDLITTSRAAELLGLDLKQMRAMIAGWVD